MLIGRSRRCDLTLQSTQVSRRHCRLQKRSAGFFLRDLGSRNGTWVDGVRIDTAYLQIGERFVVGDVILEIKRDGSLENHGVGNPRHLGTSLNIRKEAPNLALTALPLLGIVVLIGILAGQDVDRSKVATTRSIESIDAVQGNQEVVTSDAPQARGEEVSSRESKPNSGEALSTPTIQGAAPQSEFATRTEQKSYTRELLLEIAAEVDREFSAREAEMAQVLGADGLAGSSPNETSELAGIDPRPLKEVWAEITGDEIAAIDIPKSPSTLAETSQRGVAAVSPSKAEITSRSTLPRPKQSPGTEVILLEPAGPLFPESARVDLARALVEEGSALVERYHVRDMSLVPFRPLVFRLRDLGGVPAVEGLLEMRSQCAQKVSQVYRRVLKLQKEAKRAEKDLEHDLGGADAREDELTLRLADMVEVHLETLILMRDSVDVALFADGNEVFIRQALIAAITIQDTNLFEEASKAATISQSMSTIPLLIDALACKRVEIRRLSRSALEALTGLDRYTGADVWQAWWENHHGKGPE